MTEVCFSRSINKIKLDYWAEAEKLDKNKDYLLCQSESGMSEATFEVYIHKVVIGDALLQVGDKKILKSQYDILKTFAKANSLSLATVFRGTSTQDGKVVWLHLEGLNIHHLSSLQDLTALMGLNLKDTRVDDLSALSKLHSLRKLILRNTLVGELNPLVNLTGLLELDLTNTKVKDIRALRKLINLKEILLSFTEVSDIGPLLGNTKLVFVNLTKTKVPYSQIALLKGANPKATVWGAEPGGRP